MKSAYPLTSKWQIVVPKEVRQHLGLKAGSRATYKIKPNGEVTINRPLTSDEALAKIQKILAHPSGKQPLSEEAKRRGEYLAKKYNVH